MTTQETFYASPITQRQYIDRFSTERVYEADEVINKICDFLKANKDDVLGVEQYKECVHARHVCIYFLKRKTLLSVMSIARLFKSRRNGNAKYGKAKHHTVVHNADKKLNNLMDVYGMVRNQMYQIEQLFI